MTLPPSAPVRARIVEGRDRLTPAERRVAEVVLDDPGRVAFGTVAGVARHAGTSGPSVVRFAHRLGFDGFVGLQAAIRGELGRQLRPATERIRERPAHDLVRQTMAVELDNVHQTLAAVESDAFRTAVDLLSARSRPVRVVSGDPTSGIATVLADALAVLRTGVELVAGTDVQVARSMAHLEPDSVVVVVDLRRYERWVVEAAAAARSRRSRVVAITDSALSPLAVDAAATFVVTAESAGPFDSQVGTLALVNALVAGVAARLRSSATERLDRVEDAWRSAEVLLDP